MSNRTKRLHRLIKPVIDRWNPYALLGGEDSAPADEFEPQIEALTRYARWFWTSEDAAEAIARVFGRAFGPTDFTRDMCTDVGAELFANLREEGLIPTSDPPLPGSWTFAVESAVLLGGIRPVVFVTPVSAADFSVGLRSRLDNCPVEPGVDQPRALDESGRQRNVFAIALALASDVARFRPGQTVELITPP